MKRYIKNKKHIVEYTVPVDVYFEVNEAPIAASDQFVDANPDDLIKNIADKVAYNVQEYGFELIDSEQMNSNKSEAQYVRFRVPSEFLNDSSLELLITVVFRFATHKSNKGFNKSTSDTVKHKNGNLLMTVAVWFDVAGVENQSAVQLLSYIAKILTELKGGNVATLLALPKCIKKENWIN